MKEKYAIGVDIGGSHVSCAAVNLVTGEINVDSFSENDLNNQADSDVIIKTWGETILQSIEKVGFNDLAGIGLAMPGPFDYINGISLFDGKTKKYEKTYGINFSESLQKYLKLESNFPIRFINDAAAFAIGEAWKGKGSGFKRSMSITLGTGLGSGFINEDVPVFHGDSVPTDGFVWHLPYKDSVADEHFSTRGLIQNYFELTGNIVSGVKELADKKASEPIVEIIFNDFGWNLSLLLSPWLKKFQAEILIIGGNISNAFPLFKNSMEQSLYDSNLEIQVEKSELNDKAAIVGSARLIEDHYWPKALSAMVSNI